MSFSDLAREAKKNTPTRIPSGKAENLIEASEQTTKAHVEKKDISYKDSEIKGFIPGERRFVSRTNSDPRYNSIIRGIASASESEKQSNFGGASWQDCKYRKTSDAKEYCQEFHSLCAKDNCRRARR
jgi:hypothetical protein